MMNKGVKRMMIWGYLYSRRLAHAERENRRDRPVSSVGHEDPDRKSEHETDEQDREASREGNDHHHRRQDHQQRVQSIQTENHHTEGRGEEDSP